MHALAAFKPGDPLEAMLAAGMVAAQAHAMECFRRAALPDAAPADALRHTRQATALLRSVESTLRLLQRTQTARRKAEDQPSERSGWWFRSAELELAESERLLARQQANDSGGGDRATPANRPGLVRPGAGRRPRRRRRAANDHMPDVRQDPMQSGVRRPHAGGRTPAPAEPRPAAPAEAAAPCAAADAMRRGSATTSCPVTRSAVSPPAGWTRTSRSRTPGRRPRQAPPRSRPPWPPRRRRAQEKDRR